MGCLGRKVKLVPDGSAWRARRLGDPPTSYSRRLRALHRLRAIQAMRSPRRWRIQRLVRGVDEHTGVVILGDTRAFSDNSHTVFGTMKANASGGHCYLVW